MFYYVAPPPWSRGLERAAVSPSTVLRRPNALRPAPTATNRRPNIDQSDHETRLKSQFDQTRLKPASGYIIGTLNSRHISLSTPKPDPVPSLRQSRHLLAKEVDIARSAARERKRSLQWSTPPRRRDSRRRTRTKWQEKKRNACGSAPAPRSGPRPQLRLTETSPP